MDVRREFRLQMAIERAVRAADSILMNATDGSDEELDFLTVKMVEKWAEKVLARSGSQLLSYDLQQPNRVIDWDDVPIEERQQLERKFPG